MADIKYCPKCGTENPNESKFCVKCGSAFPEQEISVMDNDPADIGLKATEIETEQKPVQNKKLKKIILIAAGAVAVLILILILSNDPSKGVKNMVFGEMSMTIGEAFDLRFTDGKWSNDGDYVYYEGNDEIGRPWEFTFSLFDNDSRARISNVSINYEPLGDLASSYVLDFLEYGDMDDFNDKLIGLGVLGLIFGG